MKEDRFKHKRMEHDVNDKFKNPVTFNQSIGFHSKDASQLSIAKTVNHGIKLCNETKYADEMIRTAFI